MTVCAFVYDSDLSSINYDPISGSLKGANYGLVAFEVKLNGMNLADPTIHHSVSDSTLPIVDVTILDADEICRDLVLFDAPNPSSSSEPYDVDPESAMDDSNPGNYS